MAQRFKSLLGDSPELRSLQSRAQALSALHRHFMSVAPPHLARSSQVLGLQSGILSVATVNSAVAAKLRQLAPELVVLLQNRGCEVNGIRVKVQVSCPYSPPPSPPRKLGTAAREAFAGLGRTLEDSPLKRALEKMSRTEE